LFFSDFLGIGINGDIFGDRSKITRFRLDSFNLNEVKVAYPDSVGSYKILVDANRIGSIGGELLKRFKVTFDYPNKQITLKKSSNTYSQFYYNLSGIELQYKGENLMREKVSSYNGRESSNSNNQNSGKRVGDIGLYEIMYLFQKKPGSKIKLGVLRDGIKHNYKFTLKKAVPSLLFLMKQQEYPSH